MVKQHNLTTFRRWGNQNRKVTWLLKETRTVRKQGQYNLTNCCLPLPPKLHNTPQKCLIQQSILLLKDDFWYLSQCSFAIFLLKKGVRKVKGSKASQKILFTPCHLPRGLHNPQVDKFHTSKAISHAQPCWWPGLKCWTVSDQCQQTVSVRGGIPEQN